MEKACLKQPRSESEPERRFSVAMLQCVRYLRNKRRQKAPLPAASTIFFVRRTRRMLARAARLGSVMSNSFGFGSCNATLVFTAHP